MARQPPLDLPFRVRTRSDSAATGRLCGLCSEGNRWYPPSINELTAALSTVVPLSDKVPNASVVRKNLAYNFQYLAYLDLSLRELNLSSVLIAMTCKTYVVVGSGILEALLFSLLRTTGASSRSTKKLAAMINAVEKERLLGANELVYGCLNRFRVLRNRVHQHGADDMAKADYNSFDIQEFALMKALLDYVVGTNYSPTHGGKDPFAFLKLSADDKTLVEALLETAA